MQHAPVFGKSDESQKGMTHRPISKYLQHLLFLILAGFILLTMLVLVDPLPKLDIRLSREVQEHRYPELDLVMRGISWAGELPNTVWVVGVTALWLFAFKYRREAIYVLLTPLSVLLNTIIKFAVNRPRPTPDIVQVLERTRQQSFPSGHVLFYTVFFGFLALLMFPLKSLPRIFRYSVTGVCLFLIFTVPLSRIYLGAHWFTDVSGGFLLGLGCLYLLAYRYLTSGRSALSE
ncbi:phosphatase PAP2 family protein [Mucilaginibacter rubeus]|uniref:Phosphatase PAP2 family protein n=1 Tax=Mucilaginibacter rubeus TaxID=2027860 RepID=A0AAE6MH12_9SPHI|nr:MULTISPECIES: phosphatase PAP2 family protein [Mucilaginibacter]QEM03110.1 phosphatase PAP2 family protein [Mucilaginibacter rubeus]QEM15728.1 phosphatase PAP2 family protein [Mucilaginibacter gossypii]QTE41531.1 phosphatase PAP2 family protein [Mucilaginibacter rubeus]QTE48137.1 phosphatase PAP2 family protein [Mucilaginibacter rubeus]QTE59528.1 phosphatase PAP2 family protein [Mucilaginibacter rubeus]